MAVIVGRAPDCFQHFHDGNGFPAIGWKIYTFESNTTDPIKSYLDDSGIGEHTNPIILDERGEYPGQGLFLIKGQSYTLELRDANDVPIKTKNNVVGIGIDSSDELVKVSPTDVSAGYLGTKISSGDNVTVTLGTSTVEVSALDEKVAVDGNSTAGYLEDVLVAGDNVTINKSGDTLVVDVDIPTIEYEQIAYKVLDTTNVTLVPRLGNRIFNFGTVTYDTTEEVSLPTTKLPLRDAGVYTLYLNTTITTDASQLYIPDLSVSFKLYNELGAFVSNNVVQYQRRGIDYVGSNKSNILTEYDLKTPSDGYSIEVSILNEDEALLCGVLYTYLTVHAQKGVKGDTGEQGPEGPAGGTGTLQTSFNTGDGSIRVGSSKPFALKSSNDSIVNKWLGESNYTYSTIVSGNNYSTEYLTPTYQYSKRNLPAGDCTVADYLTANGPYSSWVNSVGGEVEINADDSQTGVYGPSIRIINGGIGNNDLRLQGKLDINFPHGIILDESSNPISGLGHNGVICYADGEYYVVRKDNIYEKLLTNEITNLQQEPTGFSHPENVIVTYDPTSRTVTLTGTVNAYYRGTKISALTTGWVSDPHDPGATTGLFLYYNGTDFVWDTTPWEFTVVPICYVAYSSTGTFLFAVRETHGLMQWQVHKQLHEIIGTYRQSGGLLSNYVLNSNTASDRRPYVSATEVHDEDLETTNDPITSASYSQLTLSGASGIPNISSVVSDIVPLNGNIPYYNEWNGSAWVQTLISNNSYMNVWLIAVPCTTDTTSQNRRFIWMQGQENYSTSASALLADTNSINFGEFNSLVPEYVVISKVTLRYTGNNWSIFNVADIKGSRLSQTTVTGGIDPSKFAFTPQSTPPTPSVEGLVYYDGAKHNLVVQSGLTTNQDVGREQWIRSYNGTGSLIPNGTAVYVSGGQLEGSEIVASVSLARSNAKSTCMLVGLATEDIANGNYGEVSTFGFVRDVNTSAFALGDVLYVSSSLAGTLTNLEPAYPNYSCVIGRVIKVGTTDGVILVSPDTNPKFG